MSLRTPLARVKGTGSAGEGTHHFWHQRITAIALVPCVVWFCFSIASLPVLDYPSLVQWLSGPLNATLMICALIAVFMHASLGLQVVIEDYVSNRATRTAGIIAVKLVCFLFGVLGVISVIKLAVGG